MKRFLLLSIIFAFSLNTYAISNRYFEIGSDVDASITNSCFSLSDLLFNQSKTIKIDFNKMSDLLKGKEFTLATFVDAEVFMNINIKQIVSFGVFADVDIDADVGVPHDLFDLVANGNTLGESNDGSFNVRMNAYAATGVNLSVKRQKFRITLRPAMFVPLVYARSAKSEYSVTAKDTGELTATAEYEIPVYSIINLDEGFSSFPLQDIFTAGGIDCTLSVDYQFSSRFLFTTTLTNIPIKPASVDYCTTYSGSVDYHSDGVLANEDGEEMFDRSDVTTNDPVTEENVGKEIYRPIKIGFSAEWAPFRSKNIKLIPDFSLVFEDGTIQYTNFGITGAADVSNMLKASLFILQHDSIWKTGLSAGINLRIIELRVGIAAYFPIIEKVFSGTGLSAGVGFRIGF